MIYTGSFFTYKGDNCVSIALTWPKWYKGRTYGDLAPPWELLKKYKENGDIQYYKQFYKEHVLDKLCPEKVYDDIKDGSVMLCWEKPGLFCHRYLVSRWLENRLKIIVPELVMGGVDTEVVRAI
jgi:hypothetical protein